MITVRRRCLVAATGFITLLLVGSVRASPSITQLTFNTGEYAYDADPSISDDGTRIAFQSDVDGDSEIWLWTDGVGLTQLTYNEGYGDLYPSISGDGTKIAFWSNVVGDEIWLWEEGVGLTRLTNMMYADAQRLSISDDGTKIAFVSRLPYGNHEIWLWTDGVGLTQLTYMMYTDEQRPSISGDGTRVAFVSDYGGFGLEIWLWTEGIGLTQLTDNHVPDMDPSISDDGSKIAFTSWDGDNEIFLWEYGIGFTQITDNTGYDDRHPSISGDGSKIAFESTLIVEDELEEAYPEIFVVNSDGLSPPVQVTFNPLAYDEYPSINDAGTRIAFESDVDGDYEIFLWEAEVVAPSIPEFSLSATLITSISTIAYLLLKKHATKKT